MLTLVYIGAAGTTYIVIPIHFRKELIKFRHWHRKSSFLKCSLEFSLIKFAIMISVNIFEQLK